MTKRLNKDWWSKTNVVEIKKKWTELAMAKNR